MSDYTYATLIVAAADQQAAKDLLSDGYFNMGLSADGTAPATHYVSAGPFSNDELDTALNQTAIRFVVKFGQEPDYGGMHPIQVTAEQE